MTYESVIAVLVDQWYDCELGTFEVDNTGWFQFRIKVIAGDAVRGDILAGPAASLRAVQIATPAD